MLPHHLQFQQQSERGSATTTGTRDPATWCSCPDRDLGHPLPCHGDPTDVSGPVSGPHSHRSSAERHQAGRCLPAPSLLGRSRISGKGRQGDHKTKVHAANLPFWPELVLLVLNPPGWEGLSSRSSALPGTPWAGVCSHPTLTALLHVQHVPG